MILVLEFMSVAAGNPQPWISCTSTVVVEPSGNIWWHPLSHISLHPAPRRVAHPKVLNEMAAALLGSCSRQKSLVKKIIQLQHQASQQNISIILYRLARICNNDQQISQTHYIVPLPPPFGPAPFLGLAEDASESAVHPLQCQAAASILRLAMVKLRVGRNVQLIARTPMDVVNTEICAEMALRLARPRRSWHVAQGSGNIS